MTTQYDRAANALLQQVWADIQARNQKRQLEAIKASPEKHRLTRILAPGAHTGYTYFPAGKRRIGKRREERFRFCTATHKNAAGVYLLWRQVDRYKLVRGHWAWHETERFDFMWSPTKKEARALAEKKAARYKADLAHEAMARLPSAPAEVQAMFAQAIS